MIDDRYDRSSRRPSPMGGADAIITWKGRASVRGRGSRGERRVGIMGSLARLFRDGGPTTVDLSSTQVTSSRARVYSAHDERGFTILESLSAAAILLIVAGGVITVLISSSGWYARAAVRAQAMTIANRTMSVILSRNASEIHFDTLVHSAETSCCAGDQCNGVWPAGIPASRVEASSIGTFTVETSLEPTTTGSTEQTMTCITVTVSSPNGPLDSTVSVTRYSSGWQEAGGKSRGVYTQISVRLEDVSAQGTPQGVRVQLLDPVTLTEVRHSLSQIVDGEPVATFANVPEGQYYLTCDPRYGPGYKPLHFPRLISPTHGGDDTNPLTTINSYPLKITYSPERGATLRVGVYRTQGWTTIEGPKPPYLTFPQQMRVYAMPVLNDRAATVSGARKAFPDESKLVYSGLVNSFGVAVIPIDFTTDELEDQHWHVWCSTIYGATGDTTVHTLSLPSKITGDFESYIVPSGAEKVGVVGVTVERGDIAQFDLLGTTNVNAADSSAIPQNFP